MLVLLTLLLALSSALAYQVTFPNANQGWSTSGGNYLRWQRVSTDPTNFTAVLVDMNNTNLAILDNSVDGTSGSVLCNAPNGGWVPGSAYRVNLAQSPDQLDSLLAQSSEFNITAGSASSSTSAFTTTSATSTTSGASTSVSSSDTSTTPTGTSAATLDADARAGLFTAVAVLTVLAMVFS